MFCKWDRSFFAVICAAFAMASAPTSAHAQSAAPIWTGVYVGAAAGYQTGELSNADGSADIDGFSAGVYAGYSFHVGQAVLGLEASYNAQDANWSRTEDDGITTDSINYSFDNVIMLKARAGVPVGQALVYATAGVAWTESDLNFTSVDNAGGGTLTLGQSNWATGYVVGGGIEVPISRSIKLRGEALYQSYDVEFDFTALGGDKVNLDYETTLIQAGVSYSFN